MCTLHVQACTSHPVLTICSCVRCTRGSKFQFCLLIFSQLSSQNTSVNEPLSLVRCSGGVPLHFANDPVEIWHFLIWRCFFAQVFWGKNTLRKVSLTMSFNAVEQTRLLFTNGNHKLKGNLPKKNYRSRPQNEVPKSATCKFKLDSGRSMNSFQSAFRACFCTLSSILVNEFLLLSESTMHLLKSSKIEEGASLVLKAWGVSWALCILKNWLDACCLLWMPGLGPKTSWIGSAGDSIRRIFGILVFWFCMRCGRAGNLPRSLVRLLVQKTLNVCHCHFLTYTVYSFIYALKALNVCSHVLLPFDLVLLLFILLIFSTEVNGNQATHSASGCHHEKAEKHVPWHAVLDDVVTKNLCWVSRAGISGHLWLVKEDCSFRGIESEGFESPISSLGYDNSCRHVKIDCLFFVKVTKLFAASKSVPSLIIQKCSSTIFILQVLQDLFPGILIYWHDFFTPVELQGFFENWVGAHTDTIWSAICLLQVWYLSFHLFCWDHLCSDFGSIHCQAQHNEEAQAQAQHVGWTSAAWFVRVPPVAGFRLEGESLKHTKKGISQTAEVLAELLHGTLWRSGRRWSCCLLLPLPLPLLLQALLLFVEAMVEAFHGHNEGEYDADEETPSSGTKDKNPPQPKFFRAEVVWRKEVTHAVGYHEDWRGVQLNHEGHFLPPMSQGECPRAQVHIAHSCCEGTQIKVGGRPLSPVLPKSSLANKALVLFKSFREVRDNEILVDAILDVILNPSDDCMVDFNLVLVTVELIQWSCPKLCYDTFALLMRQVFSIIVLVARGVSQVAPFQSVLWVEDPERIIVQKHGQRLLEVLVTPLSQVPTGGIGIGAQHTPVPVHSAIWFVDIAPWRVAPRWFSWMGWTTLELFSNIALVQRNCTVLAYLVGLAVNTKVVRTWVGLQFFLDTLPAVVFAYAWAKAAAVVWGSKRSPMKCQQGRQSRKNHEESHGFDWWCFQVLSALHLNLSHSRCGFEKWPTSTSG